MHVVNILLNPNEELIFLAKFEMFKVTTDFKNFKMMA